MKGNLKNLQFENPYLNDTHRDRTKFKNLEDTGFYYRKPLSEAPISLRRKLLLAAYESMTEDPRADLEDILELEHKLREDGVEI